MNFQENLNEENDFEAGGENVENTKKWKTPLKKTKNKTADTSDASSESIPVVSAKLGKPKFGADLTEERGAENTAGY